MSAYGIASFVEGFFNGRKVKQGEEDRKLDRDRQTKMDSITLDRAGRESEEFDWRRKDRKKADEDRAYADGLYKEAYDAALGAKPADAATPVAPEASSPIATSAGSKLKDSADAYLDEAAKRSAAEGVASQLGASIGPPVAPDPTKIVRALPGTGQAIAPAPNDTQAALGAQRSNAGPHFTVPPAPDRKSGPHFTAPVRSPTEANTTIAADGSRIYTHPTNGQSIKVSTDGRVFRGDGGQEITDPDTKKRAMEYFAGDVDVGSVARAIAPNPNHQFGVAMGPDIIEGVKNIPGAAKSVASGILTDFGGMPPPNSTPAAQPLGAIQPAPSIAAPNVPASAPAPVKAIAATATEAMAETATPAMQATADAAMPEAEALGAGRGSPEVTEERRGRASTAFIERYMEVGAPIVIEGLLKKGDIDGAKRFQDFLEAGETKAGMKDWASAAFSASVGDFDAFADHIVSGYNRMDYFGDDTSIVREQSGFLDADGKIIKGGDGSAIAGARLTFKDDKTGATFEKLFDDANDLVELGITMLSPESAFEYYRARSEKAEETALGARKLQTDEAKAAGKDAASAESKRIERINKRAADILKADNDAALTTGGVKITYEEALQQALEAEAALAASTSGGDVLGALGVGVSGEVPVYRRPTQ